MLGTQLNDQLSGTSNATLAGGLGSDTYHYQSGNGVMHIVDGRNGTDTNTVLHFGVSVSPDSLVPPVSMFSRIGTSQSVLTVVAKADLLVSGVRNDASYETQLEWRAAA